MTDIPTDEWLHDETVQQVLEDLSPALNDVFPPRQPPFSPAPGLSSVIRSGEFAVVAWEYHGKENKLAGRNVTVRGATVVVVKGDAVLYHRYIDWAGVYDQLGMVPGRPASGEVAYAEVVPVGDGTAPGLAPAKG